MTPEQTVAEMRDLSRSVLRENSPQAQAAVELNALAMRDQPDPDPGSRDPGHFAWSVRQSQRDAERRKWQLLSDDYPTPRGASPLTMRACGDRLNT